MVVGRAKNSAIEIGMALRMRWSEASDGAWLSCSMSEIVALVTPARLASSRCDMPAPSRTLRSRAPIARAEAWLSALAERSSLVAALDFLAAVFSLAGFFDNQCTPLFQRFSD